MTDANTAAPIVDTTKKISINKVVMSSAIGTLVEWYDFFIFATASALVLNKIFFPNFDPLVGTLVVLTTYAAGFIARPIGGIVFGYLGDTKGRKFSLVITLFISGLATFCIGLLPTYAQIGMWAPIALLIIRLLQGFSAGGEQANAILIACEFAKPEKRGLFGGWIQIGVPLAYVFPLALFAFLRSQMSDDVFMSWGWRIPFLLAAVLIIVGMYVRLNISESPAFVGARARHGKHRSPFANIFANDKRQLILGSGAKLAEGVVFTVYATVISAYAAVRGIDKGTIATAVLIGLLCEAFLLPIFGALSDRFGRRAIYRIGAFSSFIIAPFAFYAVYQGHSLAMTVAIALAIAVGHGAMYGAQAAMFTELFPVERRSSGVSFVQQIGTLLGSTLALMTGWLLKIGDGSPLLLVIYVMLNAAITFVCVTLLDETAPRLQKKRVAS